MKKKIFLSSPHMSDEGYEKSYIEEAFATNWISPLGANVDGFEQELVDYLKKTAEDNPTTHEVSVTDESRVSQQGTVVADVLANSRQMYAAALSSGTAAIHLALRAAGVGAGDIVFCQSLTFSATANPIIYQGATPVFIDSDYATWNMCPIALDRALAKYQAMGKLPRAVILVHLYGLSADMDAIQAVIDKYNSANEELRYNNEQSVPTDPNYRADIRTSNHKIVLIEDAAESLGSRYKGRPTGTIGDYGIYSFNGNKIITTSGGGMLVSSNSERIAKTRFWATQSRDSARHYQHSELGYNYRMSNVVAGIGRGQLKVLDNRVAKKKYIFEYYKRELGQLDGVSFMPVNDWDEPNYWLTCMLLDNNGQDEVNNNSSDSNNSEQANNTEVTIDGIITALEADNIESRPIWKPMHLQPFFADYDYFTADDKLDVSADIFNRGICLPSDSKMTDDDLVRVCNIVKSLWQ